MIHRRERFPYKWFSAVAGAMLLIISPWAPSTPFSGLFIVWLRWLASILPGTTLVYTYDDFVSAFLPFIGAVVLIYPIFIFYDQMLKSSKALSWIARTTAVLMVLLSGMAIANATLATGRQLEVAQIAVGCSIGVLLAVFGIRLLRERVLSSQIRMLAVTFIIAGGCIASFVLLPVGLLALFVAYIMLAIVLAQRKPARMSSSEPR